MTGVQTKSVIYVTPRYLELQVKFRLVIAEIMNSDSSVVGTRDSISQFSLLETKKVMVLLYFSKN